MKILEWLKFLEGRNDECVAVSSCLNFKPWYVSLRFCFVFFSSLAQMDVDSGIENPEVEDPDQREKGQVVQKVILILRNHNNLWK